MLYLCLRFAKQYFAYRLILHLIGGISLSPILSCLFQMSSNTALESKGQPKFTCGRWNPHHNCNQLATANDTSIRGWDLRTMQ